MWYKTGVNPLTAFIIAGGKSSRMGQEKAFLDLNGKQLIEYSIELAKQVTDEIFIVGAREKFMAYGRAVPDAVQDCGPLGGIYTALKKTKTDLNLVLPVDTPFLEVDFIRWMIGQAFAQQSTVTVPRTKDGLQPLTAVYRQNFLPLAEAALHAGKLKLDAVFPAASTQVIEVAALPNAFNESMFDNLNTPQELGQAAERLKARRHSAKHI